MTATREALQSWLHRPFFLAMVAAALSTLLLLAASLLYSRSSSAKATR